MVARSGNGRKVGDKQAYHAADLLVACNMRLGLETSPHSFVGGCLKTSLDVLLHCICKEALAHVPREAVPGSVCRDGHVLVEVQPHLVKGPSATQRLGPAPSPPKQVLGSKKAEARRLGTSLDWPQYL